VTASSAAATGRRAGGAHPARPWPVTALIWLGGVGLVTAVVTDILVADRTTAGSLAWICLAIVPIYLVAVWLAGWRPDHPQTRRLLILGATFAAGGLIENAVSAWYLGPQSDGWLVWVNALTGVINLLGTSVALQLIATYPDGAVERPWQRRFVRSLWALPILPVLWLLTNPAIPLGTYLASSARPRRACSPARCSSPLSPHWDRSCSR